MPSLPKGLWGTAAVLLRRPLDAVVLAASVPNGLAEVLLCPAPCNQISHFCVATDTEIGETLQGGERWLCSSLNGDAAAQLCRYVKQSLCMTAPTAS